MINSFLRYNKIRFPKNNNFSYYDSEQLIYELFDNNKQKENLPTPEDQDSDYDLLSDIKYGLTINQKYGNWNSSFSLKEFEPHVKLHKESRTLTTPSVCKANESDYALFIGYQQNRSSRAILIGKPIDISSFNVISNRSLQHNLLIITDCIYIAESNCFLSFQLPTDKKIDKVVKSLKYYVKNTNSFNGDQPVCIR